MVRMVLILALLIATALPAASQAPPPSATADSYLITPGKGIGRIRLGMQIQEVITVLGRPRRVTPGETSDRYTWYEEPEFTGIAVIVTKAGEVVRVWIQYDRRFATKEALRPGCSEREIRAAFGEPSGVSTDSTDKLLAYGWLGVYFLINLDPKYSLLNQVWQISIIPPNPATAPRLWYMGFSQNAPPGDSLQFRQAMAMAIDRESVATATAQQLRATARAAVGIEHPRLPGFNSAVRGTVYDPAMAKDLLAQSGWTGPITIWVSGSGAFFDVTTKALAESINKTLGVAVNFQQSADFDTFLQATKDGKAPIWLMTWRAAVQDFAYPSFALGLAYDHFQSDPDVRAATERRDAIAVEQILLDRVLLVPIFHY